MNKYEAQGKAYFIAARFIERCFELPGLIEDAAEYLEVTQDEIAAIHKEMQSTIVPGLRVQGATCREMAKKQRKRP